MDLLIGIDLGSTNLKAICYDLTGRAVAQASRPTELFHPDDDHPEWAVWKPEQLREGVFESLREVTSTLDDAGNVRGVAVTGMGMDGVPMTEDGRCLYPMISWHCPRTLPQQERWLESISPEAQFAISGTQVWGFNTALRLLWMAEHEPEILGETYKWVLIEDFINHALCGRFATDYSMASTTLLFDQKQRTWSQELLERSKIDGRLLCEPLPSGTVLGEIHADAARATGLAEGTPVVLGGHDYCCGMLPTGAFRPGVVLDVLGTWEMIVTATDEAVLTPEVCHTGAFVDSHVARDKYAVMGATVAADMLEWFRREFGHEEKQRAEAEGGVDWDHLLALAEAASPGAGGTLFLPHMSGGSCPVVDPKSRGAFVGLRNVATKGDMLRAMIEGLNQESRLIVRAYEQGLGIGLEKIVAVGGPTKNTLWMQNKADVLGRPVEIPDLDEAVPLGAAVLAGIGVGLYRDEQDAFTHVGRPGHTYQPDPDRAAFHARQFIHYEKLYSALRDLNHSLATS